jgi:LEA14-like dessication related protein
VTQAPDILAADVKPGRNVFAITIKSLARELRSQDVRIGQDVEARPFWIDGEVCK